MTLHRMNRVITLEEVLKELRITYPYIRHLSYEYNGTEVWEFWLDEYRVAPERTEFKKVNSKEHLHAKLARWHYISDPIVLLYHKHVRGKAVEEVVNTILEKLNGTKKVTYEK